MVIVCLLGTPSKPFLALQSYYLDTASNSSQPLRLQSNLL